MWVCSPWECSVSVSIKCTSTWWNIFSISAITAKHPSLNHNRIKIPLLGKSTPGNSLLLSNVLWNFAWTLKTIRTFLGGVCNFLCQFYFLPLLWLFDAHYVIFNLIVRKFANSGSYWNFLSSDSKWFNTIFWLAGKSGTSLFNNKPNLFRHDYLWKIYFVKNI